NQKSGARLSNQGFFEPSTSAQPRLQKEALNQSLRAASTNSSTPPNGVDVYLWSYEDVKEMKGRKPCLSRIFWLPSRNRHE
ncbi:hypothetical protein, partial [Kozakia baliensis]|uniref:hypothetical protein n=1 Tax=Kozakia baliensis TaxID=153496 RepID=UPI001F17E790